MPDISSVLIIGSGPIVIGQAAEFDYAGTQACKAMREEGVRSILVNSNPATIMTDEDVADRVYIEPLTVPIIERVIDRERPDGLLASMGPVNAISSGCGVAATIGSSADVHTAERLRLALQNWLDLVMPIPITTTEAIADRIENLIGKYPDAEMPSEFIEEDPSSLYA